MPLLGRREASRTGHHDLRPRANGVPDQLGRFDSRVKTLAAYLAGASLLLGCAGSADDRVAELESQVALLEQLVENSRTSEVISETTSVAAPTPETSSSTTGPPPEASTSTTEALTVDETVPETAPTEAPATPTLPSYVFDLPQSFDQFRFSYSSVSELPDLPTELDGFVAFDGEDRFGNSGLVRETRLRLFESDSAFTLPADFATQMNGCGDAYWILRWVSINPDVLVLASNEIDPLIPDRYDPEPGLLPPAAQAGIMGNIICYAPGFRFASAGGSLSNLVDVAVEWTYYDRDPFARTD